MPIWRTMSWFGLPSQETHGHTGVNPVEMDSLDWVPKMDGELENKMCKKKLRKLSLFSLEKERRFQGWSYCWLHLSDCQIQRRLTDLSEKCIVTGWEPLETSCDMGNSLTQYKEINCTMKMITTFAQVPAEDVESLLLEIFSPLL